MQIYPKLLPDLPNYFRGEAKFPDLISILNDSSMLGFENHWPKGSSSQTVVSEPAFSII